MAAQNVWTAMDLGERSDSSGKRFVIRMMKGMSAMSTYHDGIVAVIQRTHSNGRPDMTLPVRTWVASARPTSVAATKAMTVYRM